MKMNEFCINANKMRNDAENLSTIDSELKKCIDSLRGINENLQFSGDDKEAIKKVLQQTLDNMLVEANQLNALKLTLAQIQKCYVDAENAIIYCNSSNDGAGNQTSGNEKDKTSDENDESQIQNLIDILNGVSNSTAVDGAILALCEYFEALLKTFGETSSIWGDLGKVANGLGILTSIVSDLVSGVTNGASRNEIIADVIADAVIAAGGTGINAICVAVCSPIPAAGPVIGKVVGGVVSAGYSLLINNVDFDGDGKTGKDELSDLIEDGIDMVWEDNK